MAKRMALRPDGLDTECWLKTFLPTGTAALIKVADVKDRCQLPTGGLLFLN